MDARRTPIVFYFAVVYACVLAHPTDAARILQQPQIFQGKDLVQMLTANNAQSSEQAVTAGQALSKALASEGNNTETYSTALAQAVEIHGCEGVADVLQHAQTAAQLQGRGSAFATALAGVPAALQCLYPDCSTKSRAEDCCSKPSAAANQELACSSYIQISSIPRVFESVLDNKDKCSCTTAADKSG